MTCKQRFWMLVQLVKYGYPWLRCELQGDALQKAERMLRELRNRILDADPDVRFMWTNALVCSESDYILASLNFVEWYVYAEKYHETIDEVEDGFVANTFQHLCWKNA